MAVEMKQSGGMDLETVLNFVRVKNRIVTGCQTARFWFIFV